MKSKVENIASLRAKLQGEEKQLLESIDHESEILESNIQKNLKRAAVIGAGFALGIGLFKLLSSDEKPKKNPKKQPRAKKKMEPVFMNAGASLVTLGVKKALPIILEKLDKINFKK